MYSRHRKERLVPLLRTGCQRRKRYVHRYGRHRKAVGMVGILRTQLPKEKLVGMVGNGKYVRY